MLKLLKLGDFYYFFYWCFVLGPVVCDGDISKQKLYYILVHLVSAVEWSFCSSLLLVLSPKFGAGKVSNRTWKVLEFYCGESIRVLWNAKL